MRPVWIKLEGLSIALSLLCSSAAAADTIADFTIVPPPDVVSIQVASVSSILAVGDTLQLSVMGTFVDGQDRDVTSDQDTFYTPDPETVATVSNDGRIEALAVGSVAVMVSHIQASGELAFHQLTFCVRHDGDGDGLPDAWESKKFLDQGFAGDPVADTDGDGLSNQTEFEGGTDPCLVDTDGDLRSDALEIAEGTDPRVP